jgi:hypothetical protein
MSVHSLQFGGDVTRGQLFETQKWNDSKLLHHQQGPPNNIFETHMSSAVSLDFISLFFFDTGSHGQYLLISIIEDRLPFSDMEWKDWSRTLGPL